MATLQNSKWTADTHYPLIHGSWHAGWCWDDVGSEIEAAGASYTALDLPGHGSHALIPKSYAAAPLHGADFETKISPIAKLNAADFAAPIIAAAHHARSNGATRIVGVGHSMGGVPLTFATAAEPDLFDAIVYVASLMPLPSQPAGAFLGLPEQQENSLLGSILIGDSGVIGALRINPSSTDGDYIEKARHALAADVDTAIFSAIFAKFTPDAPANIYGEIPVFSSGDSGNFGLMPRRYIRCMTDQTLLPSTAMAIVDALDAQWQRRKTELVDFASGHEPMFSSPQKLARAILAPPM